MHYFYNYSNDAAEHVTDGKQNEVNTSTGGGAGIVWILSGGKLFTKCCSAQWIITAYKDRSSGSRIVLISDELITLIEWISSPHAA